MVWCEYCRAVIYAQPYDFGDLRRICNVFRLPCCLCGRVATFDGFGLPASWVTDGDVWGAMRKHAENEGLDWKNGKDMSWRFPQISVDLKINRPKAFNYIEGI